MGTRADFYVGRGLKAKWLGSVAWDGYPEGIPENIFKIKTGKQFRKKVLQFLKDRDDATSPKDGWPWPWEDSNTTDYAYAFDKGEVWTSCFGDKWESGKKVESEVIFPNMKEKQNVTLGKRSGLIVYNERTRTIRK